MTVNKPRIQLLIDALRSGGFSRQPYQQNRKETMTVNQARLRLLVDALRSGEFPQAHNALCTLNPDGTAAGYCCLGVATEVARRNGLDVTVGTQYDGTVRTYDGGNSVLPSRVAGWYGLPAHDPFLQYADSTYPATHLNDSRRLTLPEIGDAFERTFLTSP